MDTHAEWTQWTPPYDPRLADGRVVTQDEHGRIIESADCSQSCPGCGLCCAGYRDVVTADYQGTEEPEENLGLGRGGLVKLESGALYRPAQCGPSCPGFERCCQPYELRAGPETVADARRILLEDDASPRWAMQQALTTLAHEGSDEAVKVLQAYMPRAHTRLEGFAELAFEEGRCMASCPHNQEEARVLMTRKARQRWEGRACDAYGRIEELEEELEQVRYDIEVINRLLGREPDEALRADWRTRLAAAQQTLAGAERELAVQRREEDACWAIAEEMAAELGEGKTWLTGGQDDGEPL
ncbi:MAG TPA: hypothetical protein PLJ35_10175 [Anaerolineae bacterium]|nr:hypothetical protein [Anaerolineae bacterium]HOQ99172.1 hypothetical protein [Anaerolineae bacterium]HPL29141.1 hypothetical protein [Anaerolineae bacterium]